MWLISQTSKVALDSVLIVQEFSNVFLEDLSSLPPDRELEFEIELLSDLAFIFIPPYKMAPAELKKFKTQLQVNLNVVIILCFILYSLFLWLFDSV